MKLFLSRHGETVWHRENRYAGVSDIALTPEGRHQAVRLADWAETAPLAAVYSSTLGRAIETATPAARAAGVALRTDARLCEVDFGRGEGLTRAEMHERFPHELAAFLAQPASLPLPDGERGIDAIVRAMSALEDIACTHPNESVLVVMHSTLMRLVLCAALGLDPDRYRTVFPHVRNAALTELSWQDRRAALLGFNLPPAPPA